MDMVLLDWTRMARSYCLAGVTADGNGYRVVRPLPATFRGSSLANVGWSAFQVDGHARWERFELVDPQPARHPLPHGEDIWVRELRPRRSLADGPERRAILAATRPPAEEPLFGEPLQTTPGAVFLQPGTGRRSLVTLWAPALQILFYGSRRGRREPAEFRVRLNVPGLEDRLLSVKDHHLLTRAEQAGAHLDAQVQALQMLVGRMGDPVAVRLGLTRPFLNGEHNDAGRCWLMVDGFFSLSDPQS